MKMSDTLKFLYRFMDIRQKREIKKIADKKRNSLNGEIHSAIENHIEANKSLLK